MTQKQVEKLEIMAQDFLQYRYKMFCLMGKRDADWAYYEGACGMIESFGGYWRRNYNGSDSEEDKNNPKNYSHSVWFPSKERIENLNEDAWKD